MDTTSGKTNSVLENMARQYTRLRENVDDVCEAVQLITGAMAAGNKLLLCGNGGSAADCEHIASELLKGFLKKRPLNADEKKSLVQCNTTGNGEWLAERLQKGLPAIALTGHLSLTTAMANDNGEGLAFAQQAFALAVPGDVMMCISTSGNAANVIAAAEVGRYRGVKIIALTGENGGSLNDVADVMISVPAENTPEVQELHICVYHALCAAVEAYFFST